MTEMHEKIVKAILDGWVAGKDGMTKAEIAEAMGISTSKLAREFAKMPGGWMSGTRYTKITIQMQSRDYPGFSAGQRTVDALRPDDGVIRAEIKRLRGQQ